MLIDMHVHESLFSWCSRMSLEEAVASARNMGLDGLCITDHNSMSIREAARDFLRGNDFPLFIGVEVSSLQGDILIFGLDDPPNVMPSAQNVIDHAVERGAFCAGAHPFRSSGGGLGRNLYKLRGLHGIEVLNGGNVREENQRAMKVCRELDMVAIGGSDAHSIRGVGKYATWFPEPVSTETELVAALKSGRVRPAFRERDGTYTVLGQ